MVYCIPLFGGADKTEIKKLQVMQNKAAQLVLKCPPRTNRKLMYDRLNWLTINQLVVFHTLLMVYKIRKTKEPEYMASLLCTESRNNRIMIPNTKLSLAIDSFFWRGANDWNKLPQSLRQMEKFNEFKGEVFQWVRTNVKAIDD